MSDCPLPSPLRDDISFSALAEEFRSARPFPNVVIDNFLQPAIAAQVAAEFPPFHGPVWNEYNNALEFKKAYNHWDKFPPATYKLLSYLNSAAFVENMVQMFGSVLYSDPGLHGGGWHVHGPGGKLNMHLDYSIHPKSGLERRLNLILYIQPAWKPEWGGALGFWEHDEANSGPGKMARQVECLFNRAVIFDTSRNSWHGLPDPVTCPIQTPRNSIAVYYMSKPRTSAAERGRALYAPYGDQANDPEVLDLIKKRSQVSTSSQVYVQDRQTDDKK